MYYINKTALFVVNPLTIGCLLFLSALFWRKYARQFVIAAVLWFSFWSTGVAQRTMGFIFELDSFRPQDLEKIEQADYIVVLGGGVGWIDESLDEKAIVVSNGYYNLDGATDRIVTAVRLWKIGKAPTIVTTGFCTTNGDVRLLADMSIPKSAILCENESRNTEENACYTARFLAKEVADRRLKVEQRKIKVLLVTSASHMRRAMMIFRKCAPELECVPVASDFSSVNFFVSFHWGELIPAPGTLAANMVVYKECLGILGYKFRGF